MENKRRQPQSRGKTGCLNFGGQRLHAVREGRTEIKPIANLCLKAVINLHQFQRQLGSDLLDRSQVFSDLCGGDPGVEVVPGTPTGGDFLRQTDTVFPRGGDEVRPEGIGLIKREREVGRPIGFHGYAGVDARLIAVGPQPHGYRISQACFQTSILPALRKKPEQRSHPPHAVAHHAEEI